MIEGLEKGISQAIGHDHEQEAQGEQPEVEFAGEGLAEDQGAGSNVREIAQALGPE